ncbi:MAG: NAD(P)-binding domain-containing protein, partial [Ferruginibacter sp.]|nr:NAD(P)-binding domain-containing protein [Ferruginibacter sp.]
MKKIAIIGGGNLGTAIAEGLLKSKFCKATDIIITKRNIATLSTLQLRGVNVSSDNEYAVSIANIVILAVKPYQAREVLLGFQRLLSAKHILVSVVTGVLIKEIQDSIQKKLPVFRAMPNTAIAIQQSMTCLSFTNAAAAQLSFVKKLFSTLGRVAVIDEKLMDAATVLGACGTAYAMR